MLSIDVPAISRTIEEFQSATCGSRGSCHVFVIPNEENLLTITRSFSNVQTLTLEDLTTRAEQDLREYSQLAPGWDGYSGHVFSEEVIQVSAEVVSFVYNYFYGIQYGLTEITPGPVSDGSVDIEICDGNRTVIFNISADVQTLGIYREDEKHSSEDTSDFSWARVEQELSWFHGKVLGQISLA